VRFSCWQLEPSCVHRTWPGFRLHRSPSSQDLASPSSFGSPRKLPSASLTVLSLFTAPCQSPRVPSAPSSSTTPEQELGARKLAIETISSFPTTGTLPQSHPNELLSGFFTFWARPVLTRPSTRLIRSDLLLLPIYWTLALPSTRLCVVLTGDRVLSSASTTIARRPSEWSLSTCTEIILEVLKLNCKINEAIAEVNLKFNEELKDIIKVHPSLLSQSISFVVPASKRLP
jgi:hypothetical protein